MGLKLHFKLCFAIFAVRIGTHIFFGCAQNFHFQVSYCG